MPQKKSWKPLLALVGARPSPSLFAYCYHTGMLLLSLVIGLLAVLLIMAEALVCIKAALYPSRALPLLQHYWLTFLEGIAFTFGASVFVCAETKQEVKHMLGLVALTRADPDQPPPVRFSDFIAVSMPAWLRSLPQVDLPDTMLETLQQVAPDEPWVERLAAYLKQHAPEHALSPSILISVGDRVSISVLGHNGRRQQFIITQPQTAAIIGMLALQKKGVWLRRQDIIGPIYGEHDQNVNQHLHRVNEKLNKAAQKVLAVPEERTKGESTSKQENNLRLIEYDESGKENLWRLPITFEVEILPGVATLYEQIGMAQTHADFPPPERDTLNRSCRQIMDHYGKGLLGSYQKTYRGQYQCWPWATEPYVQYRDHCLTILDEAAKLEWAFAMEHKHEPAILHAAIRQTAQLNKWKLQVALGVIPHLPLAEQAARECLTLYRMIDDFSTARHVFRTYAAFMRARDEDWKPPKEMTEIWPAATVLEKSGPKSSASE